VQREFLYDRVRQQVPREVCDSRHSIVIRGAFELDLEPLSLPDSEHLAKPQPMAGAGNSISLRVMNLRLEHYFHDHPRHVSSQAIKTSIVW